ncbi:mechanosensitive ion channel family protein [Paucibacter sp. Y2R2-4]|uniref:mechanosensitive ion channel family protein n=1 Tax=Paucibacter sp. Y2R2-4 TaxID=2893553 RepID=UPI0021E40372|nr:mechanosensitive ion channel family protein [Paucibacter sp. Y2R2-4]MCV2350674.1 mechanosensitive ion channel family protein [Paucibacter sp. Y2R2-4]
MRDVFVSDGRSLTGDLCRFFRCPHAALALIFSACLMLALAPSRSWAVPSAPAPAASAPAGAAPAEAPVVMFNRTVAVYRAPFLGVSPAERARRTHLYMNEVLARSGAGEVTILKEPQGRVLMLDGEMALILTLEDVDVASGATLDQTAEQAKHQLQQVIAETRESRDESRLLSGLAHAAVASLIYIALVTLVLRGQRVASLGLAKRVSHRTDVISVAGTPLLQREKVWMLARWLVRGISWVLLALLSYQFLGYVLSQFPYTRPWGEQLSAYLLQVAAGIGGGILRALPDLFVALVIFMLARAVINVLTPIFNRIERGEGSLAWLDRDTVRPSRRIISTGIWLFALVMAYPYLPGSGSEAFKGVSVLLGLMISLGASSIVGQGASGLILMFSRTIRVGEFVRIVDHEGTITELGMFTTRIRTGLGEELTLPNSLVMCSVTKNYSRTVKGPGFIVDTTVTIGYDTPWRQVEAMLIEAAHRTPGVLSTPSAQVFQTALSDFYPEYRLVCQAVPSQPRPRAEVLSQLHANIQDVFNEYGVQIMSPHYLGDPAQAKFVPKSAWFAAPAKAPTDDTSAS